MKDRRLELRLSKREYDRLYVLAAADPDCRMKSGRPPSLPMSGDTSSGPVTIPTI